jgi:hypothetical protein
MDLHGWLLNLGLQQYEAAFRENDIDETLLPSLTAQDLKDIGVVVVGHRRKLLNAIGALSGNSVTVPFDRVSALDASFPDTAERRQVTVMFADLVGGRPRSPPVWTRRTCANSSRPIGNASPKPSVTWAASYRNIWATAY